jgi:hypothetical protein
MEQEDVEKERAERRRISRLVSRLAPAVVAKLSLPTAEDIRQAVLEVVATTGMGDTPRIRSYLAIAAVQGMRRYADSEAMEKMVGVIDSEV